MRVEKKMEQLSYSRNDNNKLYGIRNEIIF